MIEYFQANMWLLWTLVCIICLILELTSGDFFIMCFSLGAIPTAIVAAAGAGFTMQIVTWLVFTVLCLIFVRPFVLTYLHRHDRERHSNADALMGREGIVTEAIEPDGFGRVKIDGDSWKAASSDKAGIEAGVKVKVIGRESIIITVERI